jgi:hypothetical protein
MRRQAAPSRTGPRPSRNGPVPGRAFRGHMRRRWSWRQAPAARPPRPSGQVCNPAVPNTHLDDRLGSPGPAEWDLVSMSMPACGVKDRAMPARIERWENEGGRSLRRMRGAPMGTDLLTGSAGKARHGPWSWPIASVQAGLGEQRRDRRARGARGPARVVEFLTKHTQLSRRRLHGYRPSDARGAQVHGRARAYAADRLVERAQRASMQPRVAANAGADPGWPAAALSSCAACSSAHAQS